MKMLQITIFAIVLIAITSACQAPSDAKQLVSNEKTRKEIIDAIANNNEMSQEMMTAMMQSKDGKMAMMEHHKSMIKTMKDEPTMMNGMMKDMMNACKSDTSMMSSMCRTLMDDKEMMDRMQKMKKMKGMDDKKHY